jgi:hypothetical protein
MKRIGFSSVLIGMLGFAALVLVAATPAKAGFVVGGENGWQMSYDGMINVFMVYTTQSDQSVASERQSFRIRTGLLPSIFGFNVKSPTINGVDYAARLGLYPQIQNDGTRTGLGPGSPIANGTSLDIREVFFTADGKFGQFLVGRALNLYQGKNILTDMTLIGNGVPLNMTGGGVDLGFIGHGYLYTSFGPQFRYTTPDMSGFKLAVAIADPSQIDGATTINQPRFEAELSHVATMGSVKLNSWVSALYQEAKFNGSNKKVSSIGGAGGVQATIGPVGLLLSGFGGQGLGMTLIQDDGDALDGIGKERVSYGGLVHATYTIGKAKLGAQYGINYLDRSDYDEDTNLQNVVKSKQAVTGGVYYSVNKYLTLVGEYTFARDQKRDGSKVDMNVVSLGTVFTW